MANKLLSAAASGVGGSSVGGATNKVLEEEDNVVENDMNEQALEAIDLLEGHGIICRCNGQPPTKIMTILKKLPFT